MKEKLVILLVLLILAISVGVLVYQIIQYKRTIKALTSMDPRQVTIFRIYPRVGIPVRTPMEFEVPDPIIDEFFQSLSDLRSYLISRQMAREDQQWLLEIAVGDVIIQVRFSKPYQKGDIVIGEVGKFSEGYTIHYGSFKSQKLFQWYQKYSHRWLSPPAAPE
jgi:hypothetical protein